MIHYPVGLTWESTYYFNTIHSVEKQTQDGYTFMSHLIYRKEKSSRGAVFRKRMSTKALKKKLHTDGVKFEISHFDKELFEL